MCPRSTIESSGEIGPTEDRYEVRKLLDDQKKGFAVVDKHQGNAVVGSYPTFRQASIECTFLCLLHLKATLKLKNKP